MIPNNKFEVECANLADKAVSNANSKPQKLETKTPTKIKAQMDPDASRISCHMRINPLLLGQSLTILSFMQGLNRTAGQGISNDKILSSFINESQIQQDISSHDSMLQPHMPIMGKETETFRNHEALPSDEDFEWSAAKLLRVKPPESSEIVLKYDNHDKNYENADTCNSDKISKKRKSTKGPGSIEAIKRGRI
mmetsp:Transcript_16975/g.23741  ORF Transcript_16975/g.23741 Transcript_16975/m.23741 type:complete len:194 (-) Transcript_16975:494-1075(-)